MRIRTRARTPLLTATLAVASATALAVPASALAAPPPATESQKTEDCVKALEVLSDFHLLPTGADLNRTLCTTDAQTTEAPSTRLEEKQADQTRAGDSNTSYIRKIEIEFTDRDGRTVETERPLGTVVAWPRDLIVRTPVLGEITRSYLYRPGDR